MDNRPQLTLLLRQVSLEHFSHATLRTIERPFRGVYDPRRGLVGEVFDIAEPAVPPIGGITITWTNCARGMVSYEMPSHGLSGDIPIQRIVGDNVAACEAAQPAAR